MNAFFLFMSIGLSIDAPSDYKYVALEPNLLTNVTFSGQGAIIGESGNLKLRCEDIAFLSEAFTERCLLTDAKTPIPLTDGDEPIGRNVYYPSRLVYSAMDCLGRDTGDSLFVTNLMTTAQTLSVVSNGEWRLLVSKPYGGKIDPIYWFDTISSDGLLSAYDAINNLDQIIIKCPLAGTTSTTYKYDNVENPHSYAYDWNPGEGLIFYEPNDAHITSTNTATSTFSYQVGYYSHKRAYTYGYDDDPQGSGQCSMDEVSETMTSCADTTFAVFANRYLTNGGEAVPSLSFVVFEYVYRENPTEGTNTLQSALVAMKTSVVDAYSTAMHNDGEYRLYKIIGPPTPSLLSLIARVAGLPEPDSGRARAITSEPEAPSRPIAESFGFNENVGSVWGRIELKYAVIGLKLKCRAR